MRAFVGEMFKTVRRPAVWVCIVVLLGVAVTLEYGLLWLIATHPPANAGRQLPAGLTFASLKTALYPSNFVGYTLTQLNVLGGVLVLIVGVLLQGSEYGWSTVKTLYTQRDGRVVMLAGKLGALAVVTLVMVVALFAVTAIASSAAAILDGKPLDFPAVSEIAKGLAAMYLIFGFWALFGLMLSTLFRQSAMAIGLGLAYGLVIEDIIFGVIDALAPDTINPIRQWFPVTNGGYLAASFPRARVLENAAATPYADATHAVLVLLAYVVVFAGITAYLVRRRDVTS
jgi:ABC-type transport system involved in multi-copper enzyme maturation permease subunit